MLNEAAASPIVFNGVSFRYQRRRSPILHHLTWQVRPGITSLMGPNGAGKTTLLSLAAGSLRPDAGTITVGGVDNVRTPHSLQVSYLPQHFSFVPWMRVEEAVAHASWSAGTPSSQVAERATSALQRVDLGARRRDRVRNLSGGQRQRLGVACALSFSPSILLLDEPSVGLDPIQRKNLRDLLRSLAVDTTIVVSTHLVDDVAAISDQTAILAEGAIKFSGSLSELTGGDTTLVALEGAYVAIVGGSS